MQTKIKCIVCTVTEIYRSVLRAVFLEKRSHLVLTDLEIMALRYPGNKLCELSQPAEGITYYDKPASNHCNGFFS